MNSRYYIIAIIVIALGIVGYTMYKSNTSTTPSPAISTPVVTYGPSPTPSQSVTPTASVGPSPTPSQNPIFTTRAPTAAPTTIAPTTPAPLSIYWPNSTISFKNISNNTITINTAQLENGYPNMIVPAGMTASGTQRYNLPVLGTLAPGASVSFKMPDLYPGVSTPNYGIVPYSFTLLHLITNLGSSNIWFTKEGVDRISFNSVPIKDILVQYHP